MNEPEFEKHLRGIRPAQPRHALEERIASDLAPATTVAVLAPSRSSWLERIFPALGWCGLGAAAGIAGMLTVNLSRGNPGKPVIDAPAELAAAAEADMELEQEVLTVADGGIVDAAADGVARIVRYESLERRRWTDQHGATTVVELPREDVVFVPVSFQ
jgi:hypothetical protein